ncbi:uncharacterized protein LOC133814297 [Humulus lupulus]|uniref:uncharacterized protein LOC133814297 n=1 Tax=Humulus lupulus TaxID=3486 RepID=UPI002B410338|nr:uncharacterized protein LOC133814297 [Humulus lupulus]
MDRSWMSIRDRTAEDYVNGVETFLNFAIENAPPDSDGLISCPCKKCVNFKKMSLADVRGHLFFNGINPNYKEWSWHGEYVPSQTPHSRKNVRYSNENEIDDYPLEMVEDAFDNDFLERPDEFAKILEDAEKPIYPGSKFSKLSTLVKLYNMKARHGWSDVGFSDLIAFFKEVMPEENEIPISLYEAKKTLSTLGMEYEKIHACSNDCILYRKEFAEANNCPVCKRSRWKLKNNSNEVRSGIPAKVLWYIPPIPRFKRLFRNYNHAKNLIWHEEGRIKDGKLRHVADSPAWRNVDDKWEKIKKDPRNLRLGLSADGINPHSSLSSSYSCWPIVLVVYNLPPLLVMKRRYTMLTLLISGPTQPGNDIDVFLAPLIDDLKILWNGVEGCYDRYKDEYFTLRAVLLFTINDYPALCNLAGCTGKGYKGCVVCGDHTYSRWLYKSKKACYMGHRRYLKLNHPYRKYKNSFDGREVLDLPPEPLSGELIFEKVQDINIQFGKPDREKKEITKVGKGRGQQNDKERGKRKRKTKEKNTEKGKVINDDLNSSSWKKKVHLF